MRIDLVPHDGSEHDLISLEEASYIAVAVDRGTVVFWDSEGTDTSLHGPAVHVFNGKHQALRARPTDDGGVSVISLAYDPETPVGAVN